MKDLWPEDHGPWIRYEPDDPALLTLPPPKPDNPFDCIPAEKLFAAGVTPECYLCCQSDCTRNIVWAVMKHHPALDLATALEHIWWAPMI